VLVLLLCVALFADQEMPAAYRGGEVAVVPNNDTGGADGM